MWKEKDMEIEHRGQIETSVCSKLVFRIFFKEEDKNVETIMIETRTIESCTFRNSWNMLGWIRY